MKLNYLKILLCYWIVGWVILLLGRLGFIIIFMPLGEIMKQGQFLGLALWNILRFDFQTLAYVATIPSLVFIVSSFFKRVCWVYGFVRYYYAILYTLIAILTISDLGFYKNFHSHFNVTMFDFFNEGPMSLLIAFWEEYPVVWMCLAVIMIFVIVYRIKFTYASSRNSYLMCVVWIALVVVMMRGSVGRFPLQVEDMYVSPSQQFNDCVPNAIYSLKKAWSEKRKAFDIENEDVLLQRYGFLSSDEAWEAMGKDTHDLFTCNTDTIECQPNIVLILDESWSGYFCQLGLINEDKGLLCGMQRHLAEDIFLQNYQSVQNGTIATIENLMISTSFPRVFMSKYRYFKFPTSFATPFIQSGYKAVFMSGMDEGWENVGIGMRNQGFATCFKYDLLKEHPEYTFNSIGIYDHYVLNSLYEHLQQKSSKPRIYVLMTTTNHPPFVIPDDAKLPTLSDDFYDNPFISSNKEVREKYIKGFQYANQSLSVFLDKFKSSPAADNTIVVVTGDHNARCFDFSNDDNQTALKWRNRVPLYVYLPKHLRGTADGSYHYDANVYGCHYDILPTLAPFAIKAGVRYLGVGQNLLSDTLTQYNSYSYNAETIQADDACVFDATRRALARELLLRLYLQQFLTVE